MSTFSKLVGIGLFWLISVFVIGQFPESHIRTVSDVAFNFVTLLGIIATFEEKLS